MKKFPCTKCGLCCRHVSTVTANASHFGMVFPFSATPGTNDCEMLSPDGLCQVYENRPLICDVERFHAAAPMLKMDLASFYRLNAKLCNEMQDKAGLPKRFRVKI